jgi:glutamate synthase (ferredoxin)
MTMLQELTEDYDIAELRGILEDYVHETSSVLGQKILSSYKEYLPYFKKIMPKDYQRMLTAISRHEEQGMPHDKAVLEAFREISAG